LPYCNRRFARQPTANATLFLSGVDALSTTRLEAIAAVNNYKSNGAALDFRETPYREMLFIK
jgi:hypothetical protein